MTDKKNSKIDSKKKPIANKNTLSIIKKVKKRLHPNISILASALLILITLSVVGGCLYFYNKSLKFKKSDTEKPLTLGLKSPYDGLILTSNILEVKGVTLPNSTVVFYTETDENSVESDENGDFAGTINLQNGINTLVVTAFSVKGEEKTLVVDVVYDDSETSLLEQDKLATESSIQGVQIAKINEKETKPKEDKSNQGKSKKQNNQAIVGNVDEITGNSLIITDKKGQKKVKTDIDNSTPIVGKGKSKLKIKDLKSKDRTAIVTEEGIATMAPRLRKAIKVYHKEATFSAQLKRRAVQGIIISLSDNSITLAHQIHRERHFNLLVDALTEYKLKGIEAASLADLEIGQRLVAVGDLDEAGYITARRIHIIPGKATGIFKKLPVATESAELNPPDDSTPSGSQESTPSASPLESIPSASPIMATTSASPTQEL